MAQNNYRLINATELEAKFANRVKSSTGTWSGPAYASALEELKAAPTVDAVQVVRCSECVHQRIIDGFYACCKFMDSTTRIITNPRNYCSAGRKKADK